MKRVVSPLLSFSAEVAERHTHLSQKQFPAGSNPALRTPSKTSDSSTDRIPGYEPDDVGSIPPLTTIPQATRLPYPPHVPLSPCQHAPSRKRVSPCQRVNLPACPLASPLHFCTGAPLRFAPLHGLAAPLSPCPLAHVSPNLIGP